MKWKDTIAEAFFMPREGFGDECVLTLVGMGELRLSGRHRLLLCTQEELRMLVLCGGTRHVLSVTGRDLHLLETGPDRTVAAGTVDSVQFLS